VIHSVNINFLLTGVKIKISLFTILQIKYLKLPDGHTGEKQKYAGQKPLSFERKKRQALMA
jgi:hypothetical protein